MSPKPLGNMSLPELIGELHEMRQRFPIEEFFDGPGRYRLDSIFEIIHWKAGPLAELFTKWWEHFGSAYICLTPGGRAQLWRDESSRVHEADQPECTVDATLVPDGIEAIRIIANEEMYQGDGR